MVGVKTGYESIALYRDVLVNVNMSSTLITEMGSRERPPAAPNLKKQNGDEGEDVDITPKQMVWESQQSSSSSTFHSRCQRSKDPHELGDAEMIHILNSSSSGSVMLHNHGRLHRSCTIKSAADNPDICWMVREIMETLSSNSMGMNRGPSEPESR